MCTDKAILIESPSKKKKKRKRKKKETKKHMYDKKRHVIPGDGKANE